MDVTLHSIHKHIKICTYIESSNYWQATEGWLNSFWRTNERRRPSREMGNHRGSPESTGNLWEEVQVSSIVHIALHLDKAMGSALWVLWPTGKMAAVCSQPCSLEPSLDLNKRSKQYEQGIPDPSSSILTCACLAPTSLPACPALTSYSEVASTTFFFLPKLTSIFSLIRYSQSIIISTCSPGTHKKLCS